MNTTTWTTTADTYTVTVLRTIGYLAEVRIIKSNKPSSLVGTKQWVLAEKLNEGADPLRFAPPQHHQTPERKSDNVTKE